MNVGWEEQKDGEITPHFQPMILQFLACPLSEKTLRCEESTDELINEYVGIAYQTIDGIFFTFFIGV